MIISAMLQCYTCPWFIQGAIHSWRFSRGQTRWCCMFACAWQGAWTIDIHNAQQTQITYAHVTKTMGNTNKYMQSNCDQATALSKHENSQMRWPIGLECWIPQTTSSDKPAAPKFPLAIRIVSFRSCRCTSTWWIPQSCKLMICMARNYSCSTHKLSSPKMPRVHLIWRCICWSHARHSMHLGHSICFGRPLSRPFSSPLCTQSCAEPVLSQKYFFLAFMESNVNQIVSEDPALDEQYWHILPLVKPVVSLWHLPWEFGPATSFTLSC